MKYPKLSKTAYLEGLRCPKLLWLRKNRPDLADPPDPQTQYLFETGHRVEEYARQLFPGGALVGSGQQGPFSRLLAETESAMASNSPYLYEATFVNDKMLCRTDVLHRWDNQRWTLGEIKMGTRQKPEHIDDIAFQVCCLQDAGHVVERSYLVLINKEYIRQGGIDPNGLFLAVDLTKEVAEEATNVRVKVEKLIRLAKEAIAPLSIVGSQCTNPGKCPFYKHCHDDIPPGSIFELPYGNRLIPILLSMGIHRLEDIPSSFPLSTRQAALVESARTGQPVINSGAIKEFLKQLKFPIFLLDFESINSVIPPYDNSSPFERIPFQFSLHVQEEKGGKLQHYEFLPETASDPRQRLCEDLLGLLGSSGSIVAFNAPFEESVLRTLSERLPKYSVKIYTLLERFVDLIVPFKSGAYTDYRCQGSASLKKVLPVLVPSLSYGNLAIGKGDDASLQFQKFVDGQMSTTEWDAIRQDLLSYCAMDTLAMAEILNVLYKLN